MINSGYRRKSDGRTGFLRGIKRLVVLGLTVSAIAYIGAKAHFDEHVDRFFNGERQLAEGYSAVEIQRVINREGKAEVYVAFNIHNGVQQQLPVLAGQKGPQIGSIDYALENLDRSRVTGEQALSYAQAFLDATEPEQRTNILLQYIDFSKATPEQARQYAGKAWERLEPRQKYEIISSELERMLK